MIDHHCSILNYKLTTISPVSASQVDNKIIPNNLANQSLRLCHCSYHQPTNGFHLEPPRNGPCRGTHASPRQRHIPRGSPTPRCPPQHRQLPSRPCRSRRCRQFPPCHRSLPYCYHYYWAEAWRACEEAQPGSLGS